MATTLNHGSFFTQSPLTELETTHEHFRETRSAAQRPGRLAAGGHLVPMVGGPGRRLQEPQHRRLFPLPGGAIDPLQHGPVCPEVGQRGEAGQGRQGLSRNHPQPRAGHRRRRGDHEEVLPGPGHQGLRRHGPHGAGEQRLPGLLLQHALRAANWSRRWPSSPPGISTRSSSTTSTSPTASATAASPPRATRAGPSSAPSRWTRCRAT